MGTLKRGLLTTVGVAVGIITLRGLRKRRSVTTESEAVQSGHEDADTAAEHAAAATEHARLATKKAMRMEKSENR